MIHFFPSPPSPASIVLYLDPVTYFFSKYSHREGSPRSNSTTYPCIFKTILAKIQIPMLNCAPFRIFCISNYFFVLLHCFYILNCFRIFPLSLGRKLHTIVKYLKNTNDNRDPNVTESIRRSLIRELGNRSLPIVAESIRRRTISNSRVTDRFRLLPSRFF